MQDVLEGKTVLIIDDDREVLGLIERIFSSANVQVYTVGNGKEGLRQFYAVQPDLVILDIMLPDLDGLQVCTRLRELSTVPILMLTALERDNDIISGLECGADDYVTKPFNHGVLLARARSILRRTAWPLAAEQAIIYHDDYLSIDLERRQISVDHQPVTLTTTEYRVLAYLLHYIGRTRTYRQILEHIWGSEYINSPEYVHVYVSRLRKKLEKDPTQPRYLLTEHGAGYSFHPYHSVTLS